MNGEQSSFYNDANYFTRGMFICTLGNSCFVDLQGCTLLVERMSAHSTGNKGSLVAREMNWYVLSLPTVPMHKKPGLKNP